MSDTPKYVDERKVSEITGIALPTLRNSRFNRRGIPWIKCGRSVRYALSDVINYMESRKIVPEGNNQAA
jgi:phage terminase Nu1 subunit (DNA packaging protein)